MLSGEIRTHIKGKRTGKWVFGLLLAVSLCLSVQGSAQTVWEYHGKEVYNYLSRMAQKGLIVFNDNIRPLSRKYIGDCLDSLSRRSTDLSVTEKKELSFYSQEYGTEMDTALDTAKPQTLWFKKDPYKRWRSFYASNKEVLLVADPVFTASTYQGSGTSINKTSSGVNFWGRIGKHWGFQFFYNDITESGTGIDFSKQFSPETGYVKRDTTVRSSLNYSHLRANISYSWRTGSLSFGQDYLLWGYGQNGKVVLSDKAPVYPYIRFDQQIFPWMTFNYTHAWLSSAIVDSTRTIHIPGGVYGGDQEFFVPKYMATHTLQIRPLKGLDLSIGESIIYNDPAYVGYLFPLMFFKVYDNMVNNGHIVSGSNGQFFAQLSSRNHIPKTHLYGTLFIDEIRTSTMFNSEKSRNQLGGTFGASVTDVLVPYLTLGLEYTRIQPFVYRNLLPAQNYTSNDFLLGDWMGSNADRISYSIGYTPIPKLKCQARYQSIRKGGMGTLAEQYFQEPQPPFLSGPLIRQQEFLFQCSYEWINNLSFTGFYQSIAQQIEVSSKKTTQHTFSIGFTYGL